MRTRRWSPRARCTACCGASRARRRAASTAGRRAALDAGPRGQSPTPPDLPSLTHPGMPPSCPGAPLRDVQIWSSTLAAASAGAEADAWLSEVLRRPVRLVYLDDPTRRATNPAFSQPGDVVSFADGYPMLLASRELAGPAQRLDRRGPASGGGSAADHAVPAEPGRARARAVRRGRLDRASGSARRRSAWRRAATGACSPRSTRRPARSRWSRSRPSRGYRRWDGKTWFAANLVPETPGRDAARRRRGRGARGTRRVGRPIAGGLRA